MRDMTQITIDVEERDFRTHVTIGCGEYQNAVLSKAKKAYEKEKNKIQEGDWVTSDSGIIFKVDTIDIENNLICSTGMGWHPRDSRKLSPELQEALNKEIT